MKNREEPKVLMVKTDTINAVLGYLSKQPFEQVVQLIGLVQSETVPQFQAQPEPMPEVTEKIPSKKK